MNLQHLFSGIFSAGCLMIMTCGNGPELVFPDVEHQIANVSGFVSPQGVKGMAYLYEAAPVDSAVIDSATGYFSFDSIPYGPYQLRIAVPGFGIPRQNVYINDPLENLGTLSISTLPSQVTRVSIPNGSLFKFSGCSGPIQRINTSYLSKGDSAVTITVSFGYRMDTASLREALHLEPELSCKTTYLEDGNGGMMTIGIPLMSFFRQDSVTIVLGEKARTVFSQHLDFDLKLTYFADTACSYAKAVLYTYVRSIDPYDGQYGVDPDSDIVVEFRGKMDEALAEKAISITPVETPAFYWATNADGSSRVRIAFPASLNGGVQYRVTIDSTARTADSVSLPTPVSFSFTTQPLRIMNAMPANGTSGVAVDLPLIYTTNLPIDSASFYRAFSVHPVLDSVWITLDSNAREVTVHHTPFIADTTYTVSIDTALRTQKGSRLQYATSQKFTTTASSIFISGFYPPDSLVAVSTQDSALIVFSRSMLPASVEQRLSIAPAVPFKAKWETAQALRLILIPLQTLRANTTYTVTVDSGYLSSLGEKGTRISFAFRTAPLAVTSYAPLNGQINVSPNAQISFTFNTPVDTAEFISNLTSTPAIDGIVLSADTALLPCTAITLLHAPLAPDTTYTMTLGGGITDLYDVPMGAPVVLRFATKKSP